MGKQDACVGLGITAARSGYCLSCAIQVRVSARSAASWRPRSNALVAFRHTFCSMPPSSTMRYHAAVAMAMWAGAPTIRFPCVGVRPSAYVSPPVFLKRSAGLVLFGNEKRLSRKLA